MTVLATATDLTLHTSDLPEVYSVVSARSKRSKQEYRVVSAAQLVVLGLATVVAVIPGHWPTVQLHLPAVLASLPRDSWPKLAAAVLFLVALLLQVWHLTRRPDRVWYRSRFVAENVKSLSWHYAVGGAPFSRSNPSADQAFSDSLVEVIGAASSLDLAPPSPGSKQISDRMMEIRECPLEQRKQIYRKHRLLDQEEIYYQPTAARYTRAARFWSGAAIVLQIGGIAGAVVFALGYLPLNILGIAGTITTACFSWGQLNQYARLAQTYGLVARQLGALDVQLQNPSTLATEDQWAAYVNTVELLMAEEHQQWRSVLKNQGNVSTV